MAQAPSLSRRDDKYTAVIFVHGMGPQTRHNNLGQLLQALETQSEGDDEAVLRSFTARTEPSRTSAPDDVQFMQFDRFEPRINVWGRIERWRLQGRYRAYEAYWSPVTARGAPAWQVALWALGRLAKPDEIAKRSWREATRLRIARLHRLRAQTPEPDDPALARGLKYIQASLLSAIQRFRGAEGARFERENPDQPMDSEAFAQFASDKLDKAWHARIVETVRSWNSTALPVENLAKGLSRHLHRFGAAGLLLLLALVGRLVFSPRADVGAIVVLVILAVVMVPVSIVGAMFLSATFSDVFIWNNTQDRDLEFRRRQEILAKTRALFEHVVDDERCKRVVIVAHSLGTAITLDTLSLIGRRNEARAEAGGPFIKLNKVSHLFTLGSPIDKIFYFFSTQERRTYRAGRLSDDLRGDLSQEPFFRDGRQRFRWLNIWDKVDIVSDPLFTPLGTLTDGSRIVSATIENHEVDNTSDLDPVTSHTAYLSNPYVVDSVATALFKNKTDPPIVVGRRNHAGTSARLRDLGRMVRRLPVALIFAAALAVVGWAPLGLLVACAPVVGPFMSFLQGRPRPSRPRKAQPMTRSA